MSEPALKKAKISEGSEVWDHDPQEVVRFRLVESMKAEEMEEEIAAGGIEFDAEFFHQHFGQDDEGETRIKGYKDLQIDFWMSAQTYHTWLDVKYSKKKMGADKLEKVMKEGFPLGYVKSKEDFIKAVTSAAPTWPDLTTMGENMATIPLKGDAKVFIKRFNLAECPKPVQELHGRFEPLLLFFIDGAQIIEKGDPKWDVLMLIQPTPKGNYLLGLTTMYNFWAYPDNIRLRLSQILVLPPYQDAGLGKCMLQVTYDIARARQCVDLTIEDPTPNLQCVREKLEVEQLLATPWAAQMASEARLVWETLLYVQPGLWQSEQGRARLSALIAARIEESHFSHCAYAAERKRLVQTSKEDERNFIVMRVSDNTQAAAGDAKKGESGGECAHGRVHVVTMSAEEKATRMNEMVEERVEQMATLKRLIDK